ncbi:phage antirepressor KilAC domain-containing protein [Thomasclavelia spiroformis]|uniref:phage antirepressor KilAC domain-containing protein n=1 Tax=Thomasclavelia spiroformis TaxID=29348 RepID=UPI002942CFEE|nr:phage antirepressor KilAC domain-containing protein [Thomasclavelia spiroformis]
MNELLKVNYEADRITLSARELYEFLEIKTHFKDWFPRMCEYGFEQEKDFRSILSKSTGGRPSTDYEITLDMAKEISMIQRNEKGKLARQYFIEVEKQWNSPERVIARGLIESQKMIENLNQQIVEMRPKALFADAVSTSKESILIGQLAKLIKQNGYEIGQNRLFQWLRENGYLIKGGSRYNQPTQKAMDLGLFEVKERTVTNSDGSIRITLTTKVTGKGQIYFVNKFCKS